MICYCWKDVTAIRFHFRDILQPAYFSDHGFECHRSRFLKNHPFQTCTSSKHKLCNQTGQEMPRVSVVILLSTVINTGPVCPQSDRELRVYEWQRDRSKRNRWRPRLTLHSRAVNLPGICESAPITVCKHCTQRGRGVVQPLIH